MPSRKMREQKKESGFDKALDFIKKHGRMLLVVWLIAVAIVAGFFLIKSFVDLGNKMGIGSAPTEAPTPRPTPTPDLRWKSGIATPTDEPISLTWHYRPRKYTALPNGINVLSPTWYYVEKAADGSAVLLDTNQLREGCDYADYVLKAHEDGAQVWPTIVSHNPSLSDAVIHNEDYREAFMRVLENAVEEYNFDGICFDFENMNPAHAKDYSAFVAETRRRLGAGVTIAVATTTKLENPSPSNWWQCYDFETLQNACDFIAIMMYDQHGTSSESAGPVASIYWAEEMLRIMLRDVPSSKMLLGVPFYGRDFRFNVDESGMWSPIWTSDRLGTCPVYVKDIRALLLNGEYTDVRGQTFTVDRWVHKDTESTDEGCKYIEFIDTNEVAHRIWYDDEETIYDKARLAMQYRLSGTGVWEAAYAVDELWDALAEGITAEPLPLPEQ